MLLQQRESAVSSRSPPSLHAMRSDDGHLCLCPIGTSSCVLSDSIFQPDNPILNSRIHNRMALRLVSKKLLGQQVPKLAARAFGAAASPDPTDVAPSVFDKLINLTIVDPSGARRKIPAMVGTSLYEACETNQVELGPMTECGIAEVVHSERWTEPVFGDGPTSGYDHVVLSGPGVDTATPVTRAEERMIEDYWDFDEIFPESRLASMVKLTKAMDGMIVYVPPRVDDSNP